MHNVPIPLPWIKHLVSLMLFGVFIPHASTSQDFRDQARFHIQKGNRTIGQVLALKHVIGEHTNYVMTSHSEFSVAWKQVVSSRMTTEYLAGRLIACGAVISMNGTVRDSSYMARGSDRCYVFPEEPFACERSTQWTTARMYFEEPVAQPTIFVESALRALAIVHEGHGRYLLTFPNGNSNLYVYRGGVLQEIHVKRTLVSLVFRRV